MAAGRKSFDDQKHEPVSDIDTEWVDSLKALDPERPIREADISCMPCGPFFKNRHAIIPGLARFNLAWRETSALLSCRGAKNLLRGQQLSRPSVKSKTPSYVAARRFTPI